MPTLEGWEEKGTGYEGFEGSCRKKASKKISLKGRRQRNDSGVHGVAATEVELR